MILNKNLTKYLKLEVDIKYKVVELCLYTLKGRKSTQDITQDHIVLMCLCFGMWHRLMCISLFCHGYPPGR